VLKYPTLTWKFHGFAWDAGNLMLAKQT